MFSLLQDKCPSLIVAQRRILCYTPIRPLQNRVMSMDMKEKALRFCISILESLNDLLTAAVVGILLVASLIHYFNWKYDKEQEPNPPETAAPVTATLMVFSLAGSQSLTALASITARKVFPT